MRSPASRSRAASARPMLEVGVLMTMDMVILLVLIGSSFKCSSLQFVDAAAPRGVITDSNRDPAHETKRLPRELYSLGWKPNPATLVSVLAPSAARLLRADSLRVINIVTRNIVSR